jgi:hypothetical protein
MLDTVDKVKVKVSEVQYVNRKVNKEKVTVVR